MYKADSSVTGRYQDVAIVAEPAREPVVTGTRAAVGRPRRVALLSSLTLFGLLLSSLLNAPSASAVAPHTASNPWPCWIYDTDDICQVQLPAGWFNFVYRHGKWTAVPTVKPSPSPTPKVTRPTPTPKVTPKPTVKPTSTPVITPEPTPLETPPPSAVPAPSPKTVHASVIPERDITFDLPPTPTPTPVVVAVAPDDTNLSRPDASPTRRLPKATPGPPSSAPGVPGSTTASPSPVPAIVYGLTSSTSSPVGYSTILIALLSGFTLGVAAVVLIAGRRRTRRAL